MVAPPEENISPEEYLAGERQAKSKSEYVNGQVFAMAGASRQHNAINMNVSGNLWAQLRGRGCNTFASDMRVLVEPTGLYTYPDTVVVCGEARYLDDHLDTLLNPTLIVEVLSPSSEAYDRGAEFSRYRRVASLQEYLVIAQDRVYVEHAVRQGSQWVITEVSDVNTTLALASIGCSLALTDVYEGVEPEPSSEPG